MMSLAEEQQVDTLAFDDDDENDDSDDDSSSALSDDTFEPEYDRANAMRFATICQKMEELWKLKLNKSVKRTADERFDRLLPPKLLKAFQPQSVFPLFRLIMAELDSSRNIYMKEKLIAGAYCRAMGFAKGTSAYEMLHGYTDPLKVPRHLVGDLSLVIEDVLKKRENNEPSRVTVGTINKLLDELAGLRHRNIHHNHQWRNEETTNSNNNNNRKNLNEVREKWLIKVRDKGLSPLEHKWLVRILLKKVEFGLGWKMILPRYSRYAMNLYNANNSLKNVCDKLANPEFQKHLEEQERFESANRQGTITRWAPQSHPATLGSVISPMFSARTTFESCMSLIASNHAEYLKAAGKEKTQCLALKFPAICAEVKLDGERMLAHVVQGKVTLQTRNSKWYSDLYSPVIGAPLRDALSKYNVNVILDGEIMAWDGGREEYIPFGANRTVANARRAYLQRNNLLGDLDKNFHPDFTDSSIMRPSADNGFIKPIDDPSEGRDCWLLYSVFDILLVDGPDAAKLLKECNLGHVSPGSIVQLTCLERKQILHGLLVEQKTKIEICESIVIRPDGRSIPGEIYFNAANPVMEYGHRATLLDSTAAFIQGGVSNLEELEEIDSRRQGNNSILAIGQKRAQLVEDYYRKVVECHRKEGIVLKDLASPYIFGDPSRRRKYWHKFKPDYDKGYATDMDVVIIGAYYATGLRRSGKLTHFLLGCLDSEDCTRFMTFCNVNGGSVNAERLEKLLDHTGFKRGTAEEETELGKWFSKEDLPEGQDLPDFISKRSRQRGGEDYDGWKFSRGKNYPDLWINPEDSVVLTIYGQELVESEDYSTGLALRFARISKIRLDSVDGDEKPFDEVDTDKDFWQTYIQNTTVQRQKASGEVSLHVIQGSALQGRRFLTAEEYTGKKKKSRKRKRPARLTTSTLSVVTRETSVLSGLYFTVLDGKYALDLNTADAQEGKEYGWLEDAMKVKKREDVMKFVLKHGGKVCYSPDVDDTFVLGGRKTDPVVKIHMQGIENCMKIAKRYITKSKSERAKTIEKIAESDGVLKWTFVFSLVYQLIKLDKEQGQEANRKYVLEPKAHQFLTMSSQKEERVGEDIFSLDADITEVGLELALENYRSESKSDSMVPWQDKRYWMENYLVEDGDWGEHDMEKLIWHCKWEDNRVDWNSTIVYPHILSDGFVFESDGSNDYWNLLQKSMENKQDPCNQISSILPLVHAMGAKISHTLDHQVTHIVCDLVDGKDVITYDGNDDLVATHFKDLKRGLKLTNHLKGVTGQQQRKKIMLVTSKWIQLQWDVNYAR